MVRPMDSVRRAVLASGSRRHRLLEYLAVNGAIGVAIAVIAVGGLLALDVHGLRRLVLGDASPVLTVLLLLFGFIVTFGSVAMGTAIMMLGRPPDPPDPPESGGPRTPVAAGPLPATIAAWARRRS